MPGEEKKLFTNEQVIRLMVSVFLIGGAWARMEYKMDKINDKTNTVIEKYVIANDYEKKILGADIARLQDQVKVNTLTIEAISEFIKPEEPKRKNYR